MHNEMTFMLFIVYLIRGSGRQASTVLSYCSLVRTHLSTLMGAPICAGSPRWKKLVRAIRKLHTRERKECRPLRADHLRRAWYGVLAAPTARAANRWAAVAAGWHLLCRPAELAALRRSDLSWQPGCAVVTVRPVKKGPEQQPVPMLVARGNGSGADVYAALERLEVLDPVSPEQRAHTPLFRGHRGGAPSHREITEWVQQVAQAAGEAEDVQRFTARSMRVGGATELNAMGVPEHVIATLGRWSSDVARVYMRVSAGSVLQVSAMLSGAPADPTLEESFPWYTQTARR